MKEFYSNVVAEIQLTYRNPVKAKDRTKISASVDAYEILISQWDENKIGFIEQAKVLVLNRANQVLGVCDISTGGVAGTIMDPKLVFAAAIKANGSSIVVSHNHPSGNLQPSESDIQITRRLREGGKLLDITLHDHLIVSPEGYYSFTDELTYDKDDIEEKRKQRKLAL